MPARGKRQAKAKEEPKEERINPFENPTHIRGTGLEIDAKTTEKDWKNNKDWASKKFEDRETAWYEALLREDLDALPEELRKKALTLIHVIKKMPNREGKEAAFKLIQAVGDSHKSMDE